ncbi:hypothetical protein CHLRE_15g640250v5 [Chlamydomonas reinhardtii]|uniref:60S ribosomal export protein NMD3 n=1 Tax=Chlamydomonas reinhardtii TaxID=3055 RepID=A0A2K3CWM1_CHLRE|nr:uncharacterized protein CHLRE_15g640250v5 [Chlamydomonas reinhardtii]PNW72682.1 hypothetical protein CHLRE_15g640250v5 [Chlamydomonas reinhardtii]
MELGYGGQATFQPQQTQGYVLCCLCGTNILPNPSNMCVNCIRSQVDITEGIQKQCTILWCKECGRYLQPPKHWVTAELESKELLTFCIKKIKGLSKVKLVDAGFIWTEPHSKRIKVKLTIQVFNGAILQQTFVVDYVVENNMCPDCNRQNANPNSWIACVQLRQHVYHKRTFLFLEQLILKHDAAAQCVKVRDIHEGIDFFYANRSHAQKFIDFLQSVVPIRFRADKQLVSHDTHNNTYNYKFTFSVEIVPLCKDDLVFLPPKMAASAGNLGPFVLVSRITNQISLVDPANMRTHTMDAPVYYRHECLALASQRSLISFIVLDIEPIRAGNSSKSGSATPAGGAGGGGGGYGQGGGPGGGGGSGRYQLAEAQIARVSDFGKNDTVFYVRTHLGNILHPGDTVLGYDLTTAQLTGIDYDNHMSAGGRVPEIILVRKSYDEKRRRRAARGGAGGAARPWKLKTLEMEVDDAATGQRGRNEAALEADRERFMQELEEDADMRARINIYKDAQGLAQVQLAAARTQAAAAAPAVPAGLMEGEDEEDDDDEDLPQIPLEELLDDLEGLALDPDADGEEEDPSAGQASGAGAGDMDMD